MRRTIRFKDGFLNLFFIIAIAIHLIDKNDDHSHILNHNGVINDWYEWTLWRLRFFSGNSHTNLVIVYIILYEEEKTTLRLNLC